MYNTDNYSVKYKYIHCTVQLGPLYSTGVYMSWGFASYPLEGGRGVRPVLWCWVQSNTILSKILSKNNILALLHINSTTNVFLPLPTDLRKEVIQLPCVLNWPEYSQYLSGLARHLVPRPLHCNWHHCTSLYYIALDCFVLPSLLCCQTSLYSDAGLATIADRSDQNTALYTAHCALNNVHCTLYT